MMKLNAKVLGVVAGVASTVTVVATAVAARQVPVLTQGDGPVAPISTAPGATTPSPQPGKTTPAPSKKPVATATPSKSVKTPVEPSNRPVKQTINPAELPEGEAPRIPYVEGVNVISGDLKVKITNGQIFRVARAGTGLMVITSPTDARTEMLIYNVAGKITAKYPDVSSVKADPSATNAAFATSKLGPDGATLKGSTITWRDSSSGVTQTLSRPDDLSVEIVAVRDGTVWFSSQTSETGPEYLYSWWTGENKARKLTSVPRPTAVSLYGTQAATIGELKDGGSCTDVVQTENGKRYWKTCDYMVDGFSSDGRTVLAGPAYRDGYGDGFVAALNNANGKLLHRWDADVVLETAIEDDEHILFVVEKGSKGGIVRCAVRTGECELARPFVEGLSDHDVGNPYKLGTP